MAVTSRIWMPETSLDGPQVFLSHLARRFQGMSIRLEHGTVQIDGFRTRDPAVAGLLSGTDEPIEMERLVSNALSTGARGMMSMGLGIRVEDLDARLRSSAAAASAEALRQLETAVAKAVHGLEEGIDLGRSDSHSARFLAELRALLGPEGHLLAGFRAALDPAGNSPLAVAYSGLRNDVALLRDELMRGQGRAEEAVKGTAKGVEFEERLDLVLRQAARSVGAIVEYIARSPGSLSSVAMVGDYLLILPNGCRVVVEVKNQQSIQLGGKNGILSELDRAMTNRDAQAALCISALAAYPGEVGAFGAYGSRVLVVDDGDGTMITAGLRWIIATLTARESTSAVDLSTIHEGLQRLRTICQKFTSQRAALTEVSKSVDKVSESLGDVRSEVLELVDEVIRLIRDPAEIVEMPRVS